MPKRRLGHNDVADAELLMGTLNDEILRVTGGPTVNDGLMSYYGGVGALGDRERAWLLINGGVSGTNNDLWMQALRGGGYTGTLNDMLLAYWSAG